MRVRRFDLSDYFPIRTNQHDDQEVRSNHRLLLPSRSRGEYRHGTPRRGVRSICIGEKGGDVDSTGSGGLYGAFSIAYRYTSSE